MTKRRSQQPPAPPAPRWPVTAFGVLFFLVQLALLPGAFSPFRTPKASLAAFGITAIVAFVVIGRLVRGRIRIPRGPLAVVLVALPAVQAVSALWSHSPRAAVSAAVTSLVWVVGTLWMASLDSVERDRVLMWCAAGATISAAVLLLQTAGVRVIDFTESVRGRFELTGLAGNPADLSMAAVLLLPLLLARSHDATRRWWEWGLICLLAAAAAVSLTLTAYVALASMVLVWAVRARSWRLWLGAATVVTAILAVAMASGLEQRLASKRLQLASGDLDELLSFRGDGWTAAGEMVRSRPISGVGSGNYTVEFYPNRLRWLSTRGAIGQRGELRTHFEWAHCDPLQHVAELGSIGGLWLIALCWTLARSWSRSPTLIGLSGAATAPFLLLHYPTHLALGLMPASLVLSHLLSLEGRAEVTVRSRALRWVVAAGLLAVVAVAGMWQMRRLALELWRGDLERRLVAAHASADPAQRRRTASAIELQVMRRIDHLPSAEPWLWRVVGRARLLKGDSRSAEPAFRRAYALWPHEEAEFGLGLALAAQGRRNEALVHLGNVCRVNRSLSRGIEDPDLREAVLDLVEAHSRRALGDR